MKNNIIIDCFAGGGGASVGIEMALGRSVDIAVNHDPQAIRMHMVNHPDTLHLTEDIFKVDLQKYVGDRHVALMWASPDCTSHSKAKGGQPRKKGLRILPWAVYKHAKTLLPNVIMRIKDYAERALDRKDVTVDIAMSEIRYTVDAYDEYFHTGRLPERKRSSHDRE